MNLQTNKLYHCYNQGNYQQKIFFTQDDYIYFLNKIRLKILPSADIIAYCLMPNHFHILLQPNEYGISKFQNGSLQTSRLTNGF